MQKIAQQGSGIRVSPPGGFELPGVLGKPGSGSDAGGLFSTVISTTIGVITAIAFIWFVINFILAAVQYMSAGGDANKVGEARKKMVNNIVGVAIVVSAIFIADLVGRFLGVEILNPFGALLGNPV